MKRYYRVNDYWLRAVHLRKLYLADLNEQYPVVIEPELLAWW
jgi:hypothetical protein